MALAQDQLEQQRYNMVEQQVRTWDVLDYRVLEVLHSVPREAFVKTEHRALAYADTELPLAGATGGEKLFKPVLDGRILQSLALQGEEEVLEIGTGSGYTTACLAKLARQVQSVEINADLAQAAKARLQNLSYYNTKIFAADALGDFTPDTLFDVIVLGGAVVDVPSKLLSWLKPDGLLFAVRGLSPVMEAVLIQPNGTVQKSLFETDLPHLTGAGPKKKFVF